MGTALLLMILNKNASFRNSGTFAYLLLAHIHNINCVCTYVTSARVHELSGGCVCVHIIMHTWAEWVQVTTT